MSFGLVWLRTHEKLSVLLIGDVFDFQSFSDIVHK